MLIVSGGSCQLITCEAPTLKKKNSMERRNFLKSFTATVAAIGLAPIELLEGASAAEIKSLVETKVNKLSRSKVLDLYANYELMITQETANVSLSYDDSPWVRAMYARLRALPARRSAEVRWHCMPEEIEALGGVNKIIKMPYDQSRIALRLHSEGKVYTGEFYLASVEIPADKHSDLSDVKVTFINAAELSVEVE